jgi:hypothetical protein
MMKVISALNTAVFHVPKNSKVTECHITFKSQERVIMFETDFSDVDVKKKAVWHKITYI